ncbi:hypothetical protein F4055_07975 [Candidatus Poribacteria bacterium]|nr:hypothetical protein [Candidatus Poribacteria bacterium]
MIIRLYHIGIILLYTVAMALFSSCAEEKDVLLEEPEEETQTVAEIIPPKPDWDDGVMTITVGGRFQTKKQMVQEVGRLFSLHELTKLTLMREEFSPTPLEKRYTIDVAVVTMLEVGITEPSTLQEIKERYWEEGYGPLTIEEVIELRLQLKDQPDSATGHRMSNFLTLPTSSYVVPRCYHIRNIKADDKATRNMHGSYLLENDRHFDPNDIYLHSYGAWINVAIHPQELPFRFAAMVRGSVVRK